eukprot:TRINITY_DN974_c0_g3_i2.p2 TRINITY_DN974_c0_g3~~TRINITY_DN974_c0_g3_i2.p2  ORF type:complete len:103 (-),score=9.11 TRINITY_DN974_c0_g3_i2:273-581(-)
MNVEKLGLTKKRNSSEYEDFEAIPINEISLAAKECINSQCHNCGKPFPEKMIVKCKNINCTLGFCRMCLTRHYKFSKKAARFLPTKNWKCPKCTNKCRCSQY